MKSLKERVLDAVIDREGGYVNNPDDKGGPTKYGITEAVARQNGYKGDMRNLDRSFAFSIYEARYWTPLMLDQVAAQSEAVAEELADTAINMGVYRAAEFLQRSLNVLNKRGTLYPDQKVDGKVGPGTLRALVTYRQIRGLAGEKVLFRMLNCLQGAFYVELAERRQTDETFVFGWLQNRVT